MLKQISCIKIVFSYTINADVAQSPAKVGVGRAALVKGCVVGSIPIVSTNFDL